MAEEVSDMLISLLEASGDLPKLRAFVAAKVCSVLNGEQSDSKAIRLEPPDDICAGIVFEWLESKGFKMAASVLKLEANINGKAEELRAKESIRQSLGLESKTTPLLRQLIEAPTRISSAQGRSSFATPLTSGASGAAGNATASTASTASTATTATATTTTTTTTTGSSQKQAHGSSAFSDIQTVGATELIATSGSRDDGDDIEAIGEDDDGDQLGLPKVYTWQPAPSAALQEMNSRTVSLLDGILGSAKEMNPNTGLQFEDNNNNDSGDGSLLHLSVHGASLNELISEGQGSFDDA